MILVDFILGYQTGSHSVSKFMDHESLSFESHNHKLMFNQCKRDDISGNLLRIIQKIRGKMS